MLKQTESDFQYQRHLSYYRFLSIALIGLPLFTSLLNLLDQQYKLAVVNISFGIVFGIIYLFVRCLKQWFYVIAGSVFQIYIILHSSFLTTGHYVEAALGLFVICLPIFYRNVLLWIYLATATIGYHLPMLLGVYESYYPTSFLLYLCVFLLLRYVIKDRDQSEQELLKKQQLIEQQQTEIKRLNDLQTKWAEQKQEEVWLQKFEETVQNALSNPTLQIEDLAEQLDMGRTQLFQKVKEVTQLTPNQYLMEMRLQRAKKLLESKQVENVKAAQLAVGMRQSSYFARKYKERFGVLPSESLKRSI